MKKFAKFLICVLLCSSFMFTGCSLVQRNTLRYMNRTVATVGETTITKQELLTAYNSYGYQYVQNNGYTTEKAIKTTLDGLIDRQIVLEKAKKIINIDSDKKVYYKQNQNDTGILLYNANVWQNGVWKEVFDGINEQIASIEKTVRAELNITDETSDTAEEEKQTYDAYKKYEKKVQYENGKWSVIFDELTSDETALTIGNFVQDKTGNSKVSSIAIDRYIKQLTIAYKDKNLTIADTKVSQSDFDGLYASLQLSTEQKIAFLYELNRIYDVYDENKYITEFQSVYEKYTQKIDTKFNQQVIDYYKQLVLASNEKYTSLGATKGYAAYVTDMQSDSSTVYFHPEEYGKFVSVSHVLIKLSDEQLAEIKTLKANLSNGVIGQEQYDDEYQKVLDKTVVYARDEDGKETKVKKTVSEVYSEINAELAKYDTVQAKAEAFNKFIYKYGQDTGMINATHYYAVNMDTSVEDKMVKNFADKSRELATENPNGGNLGEPVFVSEENYSGYHIIFNAGIISDNFSLKQIQNLDADSGAINLYNTRLMLGTEKSLYDVIYDKIYASTYSDYQTSLVNTAKQNLKITYYVDAYKDLY